MTQNPWAGYTPPAQPPQGTPAEGVPAERPAPSEGMDCPECGQPLANMAERRKHATQHYGDDLIAPYPDQNLAAERKGSLLDTDPDKLRGWPRNRR